MRTLITGLPRSARTTLMIVAGILFVWLMLEMDQAMEPAVEGSDYGIVGFEFAGSPDQASKILDQWGEDGRDGAAQAIKLDFGYLVAYSVLLALASGSVAIGAERRGWRRTAKSGWLLAALSPVAGLLDAGENAALLSVIRGYDTDSISGLATVFAAAAAGIKFAIVIAVVLFVVFSIVAFARKSPNKELS